MSSARKKQPKGMSPKHVRKAHIVRSSGNDDPIFCGTTFDKYYSLSPNSTESVRPTRRVSSWTIWTRRQQRLRPVPSVSCLATRRVRVQPTPPPARQ